MAVLVACLRVIGLCGKRCSKLIAVSRNRLHGQDKNGTEREQVFVHEMSSVGMWRTIIVPPEKRDKPAYVFRVLFGRPEISAATQPEQHKHDDDTQHCGAGEKQEVMSETHEAGIGIQNPASYRREEDLGRVTDERH